MSELAPFDGFMASLFPRYGEWLKEQDAITPPRLRIVHKHIYVIQISGTSLFKIGYTTNPERRLVELQISSPVPLEFHAVWIVPKQEIEIRLHQRFKPHRKSGEWFELSNLSLDDLASYMKDYKRVQ